jgi:hypothetical protein
MREFEFGDKSVFIRRGAISPFLAAFGAYQSRGEKVVIRHLGVTELSADPNALFSLVGYLSALRELQEQFGPSFIRKMGSLVFSKAVFPPGLDTTEKVLDSLNVAFHMNHDDNAAGKIGSYQWTPTGDRRGTMVCDNPYPCALDLGILEAVATRFSESGKVVHDDSQPCRHKGGNTCTYSVEW